MKTKKKTLDTGKAKVLIVDDEETILELVEYSFKSKGFEVLTAMNGEKGLELALNEKPDIAILDLMLPGRNGFEVCKIMKKTPCLKNCAIIILTAKDSTEAVVEGFACGADDFVTKPFHPKELVSRALSAHLRRKEMRDNTRSEACELVRGGVNHKFNQPMTVINCTLELFERLLDTGVIEPDCADVVRESVNDSRTALKKMSQLLEQLSKLESMRTETYLSDSRIMSL